MRVLILDWKASVVIDKFEGKLYQIQCSRKFRHVIGPSSFEVFNETLNVLNKKFL